jgi:hypothetical protein
LFLSGKNYQRELIFIFKKKFSNGVGGTVTDCPYLLELPDHVEDE